MTPRWKCVRADLGVSPVVRRWEETDAVLQAVAIRLWRALQEVRPDSPRAFVGLAATQIRRELTDQARHHRGAQADAAHHHSDPRVADSKGRVRPRYAEEADPASGPISQLQALELHEHVQRLPDEEREVFQLLFYQDLSQEQVAQFLGGLRVDGEAALPGGPASAPQGDPWRGAAAVS
jgi:RNA polymerase sigma-70 factor (ECF subfamily)